MISEKRGFVNRTGQKISRPGKPGREDRLFVKFLVGVVVVFGAESLAQAFFHAAVSHAEIVPAADQQADESGKGQAGADDLHDHARGFAHNSFLLMSKIESIIHHLSAFYKRDFAGRAEKAGFLPRNRDENFQKGLRFLMSCGILHMLE